MDYKDEVSRNTAIKKEHLTELSTAITALMHPLPWMCPR